MGNGNPGAHCSKVSPMGIVQGCGLGWMIKYTNTIPPTAPVPTHLSHRFFEEGAEFCCRPSGKYAASMGVRVREHSNERETATATVTPN